MLRGDILIHLSIQGATCQVQRVPSFSLHLVNDMFCLWSTMAAIKRKEFQCRFQKYSIKSKEIQWLLAFLETTQRMLSSKLKSVSRSNSGHKIWPLTVPENLVDYKVKVSAIGLTSPMFKSRRKKAVHRFKKLQLQIWMLIISRNLRSMRKAVLCNFWRTKKSAIEEFWSPDEERFCQVLTQQMRQKRIHL